MVDTRNRLLEKYNSYRRRPTIENPQVRKAVFATYHKLYDPWLPALKEQAVLDIACGEGTLLYFLKEIGYQNLAGFDLSPENVDICHRIGLDFVFQGDALQLETLYPPEKFDLVFARGFLEHIPKPGAVDFAEVVSCYAAAC